MAKKNNGFTQYQQTLFNKYEVDESYLQTRKQRRACLELLEKVDKNQVTDEKKLIGKIAAAFEGTALYKRITSCVTIAALLVTLQGAPVMASAETAYQNRVTASGAMTANTGNSVVMDEDSFLAYSMQKPTKTEPAAVQPSSGSEKTSGFPAANSVLLDDDSDVFRTFSLTNAENKSGNGPVTVTFEDHDKIENIGGNYIHSVIYDMGEYKLFASGFYQGMQSYIVNGDTVVQSVGYNFNHNVFLYDGDFFDLESISITNNSCYSQYFTFSGGDYFSYSYGYGYPIYLKKVKIEPGIELKIDFDNADSIIGLIISASDAYGYVTYSSISIDDITISNITPITPVVSDITKYGAPDTVMNFTVSDFVYNSIINEPLEGIKIVTRPILYMVC